MKLGNWSFPVLLATVFAVGAAGVIAVTSTGTAHPSDVLAGEWAFGPDRCDDPTKAHLHFADGKITMRRGSLVRDFGSDYEVVKEDGLVKLDFTHSESRQTIVWHLRSTGPGTLQLTLDGMPAPATAEQRAKFARTSLLRCA
jgi:hypothetical protein